MYFVVEFDRDIDLANTVVGNTNGERFEMADQNSGEELVLNLAFAKDGAHKLNFTVSTSFISFEQAEQNALSELKGKSIVQLKEQAEIAWEEKLSKIEIEALDADGMKTFYSCLYRMFLFPRVFYEFDANGNQIHYSPADGKVHDGPLYTDNGFFDTYMTVYPLFSLILAEEYAEMCQGFLNYYKESGWLPRWMSPAALDSMPGTFIDQVFADAVAKGIVTDKETVSLMLESILKHANVPGPAAQFGRDGIEDYLNLHYVSSDYRESANKTMNYSYGDFSIATIARYLGMMDVYHEYMKRSQYYRVLFDEQTKFIRAKDKEGNMRSDFSPFDWGWDYTEGSAWQNTFAVPHDIMGLADMMGGRQALIQKVDQVFDTPPYYRVHWYGTEIHEMTEMAAVNFGQCALSNQPSFNIPYLYSMMGCPDKTAFQVRRAVKELFHWQVGFPGDDDNGSMAGWYVFSTLGFYPVCPTVPQYVLGSPAVKRCVIHTHEGTDFEIVAQNNSEETVYWRDLVLNDQSYEKVYLQHEDIMKGGKLAFTMSSVPVEKEYDLDALPYAVSKDSAEDIFE
jgi:predicted alpha-1,2-mannosidase